MKDEFEKILEKIACIDIRIVIFVILVLLVGFYLYVSNMKEDEEDCQCGAK
jgi:hypothetical protein